MTTTLPVLDNPFQLPLRNRTLAACVESVLGLRRLAKGYQERPADASSAQFLQFALDALGVELRLSNGEALKNIPKTGPVLIVANHPLGGLEGIAIAHLLLAVRPDLKVLTNQILTRVPELKELFIGVDVLSGNAARKNATGILQVNRHLSNGGAVLLFPAGLVSAIEVKRRKIEDRPWNRIAGQLAKKHNASCLPIYVNGRNSKLFYALGLIHPRLRTIMLARELANKQGRPLELRIGDLISPKELQPLPDSQSVTHYLRANTDLLAIDRKTTILQAGVSKTSAPVEQTTVADHVVQSLQDCLLVTRGNLEIYAAPFERLQSLMRIIGLSRELSFGAAGASTGKEDGIDRYDPHYMQFFIWDKEAKMIAGGYRMGKVEEIVEKHGLDALYSRSLYRYDKAFLKKIGPSLEMGRSFIHPDYQRQASVFEIIWQGIGAYVSRNPQYCTLFGGVTISKEYSDLARELIAESMLEGFRAEQKFLTNIKPIRPLKTSKRVWTRDMLVALSNIKIINRLIGRCDPGKTIPLLFRHYLSLNGKFICFSLNSSLSDSLDGLVMVDLRETPLKYLQRYFGKQEALDFLKKWEVIPCKD